MNNEKYFFYKKYSFYKEHYEMCMDGYNDTITDPNSYSGYFTSTYDYIASEYEKMAEDDKKIYGNFVFRLLHFV